MSETILVTGGAGFIGSHLVDVFLEAGYRVRVMDNLDPQVHGPEADWPDHLDPRAERIRGDVTSRADWLRALEGVDLVSHHAAAVGVGQSMYQIDHYMNVNTRGTAILLDILAREEAAVKRIMVASSMSIYGEGAYDCPRHGRVAAGERSGEQLTARRWEPVCPLCGRELAAVPTGENKILEPTSVYALSKMDQEKLVLMFGRAYRTPVTALRYFNIYGPRQALSNPYTGVAAIFSGRLLNNKAPVVFEDGLQSRDFIHVRDVARANLAALQSPIADGRIYNIGTGRRLTLMDMYRALTGHLGLDIEPEILGRFREGDIRHCYGDVSRMENEIGFKAEITFEQGVADLVDWVRDQQAEDGVDTATDELKSRGLAW